jgi:hypothetical protein
MGNTMKAGCEPESIKYSIPAKTTAKINGTLTYDGIKFFIEYGLLFYLINYSYVPHNPSFSKKNRFKIN